MAPSAAQAAGWGINLDGAVTGDPPAFSYQSSPYFTELVGGSACSGQAAARAICYARINVPWDAVNDGKGSIASGTCAQSPSGPGTQAAAFAAELSAAARAVGVGHVLVSLTTSPAGSPDDIWPTDAEYECGLSGLEQAAPGVREWEAFNEPDSGYAAASTETECTTRNGVWVASAGGQQCQLAEGHTAGGNGHGGSAQAAAYWYLDAKRVDSRASHTLLAGGFNYSSSRCTPTTCHYLAGYFRQLSAIYPQPPDAIALNPYIDVSYAALNGGNPVPPASSGLPSGVGAITAIDQVYPSDPPIWFTEVGVWLTDGGQEPVTSGCADGNTQDIGTWAACLNGNPTAQGLAAVGYLRLPEESPQVQRVYYYDFAGQNPGWDSGLVNLSPPLVGPHGYGEPRTTWCVLYAYAHGATPTAATARSLRPGGSCDLAQHGNAPTVDVAYLSDPLTPATPAVATPGEVGRDLMLTVSERVRALASTLKGSA
ncbi:MAG TPA: hypothetical protein VLC49_03500 [Solirubrobacteraceae bacterium]|nr:hypothetical protein [Solirubrobacteraceae bacterium]